MDIFNYYKNQTKISQNLIPLDVYYIKERLDAQGSKQQNAVKEIKPNYINKISYSGFEHNLPTTSISQIINIENLI